MAAPAELLADGGAAARSDDFFRSVEFLGAEGATHTLLVGGLAIPLIVRADLPGGRCDAISPYGYPGASGAHAGGPLDAEAIDWSATGLVSIFLRERIGGAPAIAGATERSPVQVHDPAQPRGVRPRLAEQIRHNEREGWTVESSPGPEAAPARRRAFADAYTETMTRADASARYFFGRDYLDAALGFDRSWLLTALAPSGEPGAGAIVAASDGLLHYFLGATADAHLAASPFKSVVAAMLDLADQLQTPLNLGGGVSAGDGLERFKRGFANAELPFRTHELVCDPDAYRELAGDEDAGGFFPAYRAPKA